MFNFILDYNDNIDESEAIARAIAESQQEYIQSVLKKQWPVHLKAWERRERLGKGYINANNLWEQCQ